MKHNSQNTKQKKINLIDPDNAIVRNLFFFHYISKEPESLMLLQREVRGEMNQRKTYSPAYICRIQLSLTVIKAEL